jgi:hypothetical protein
MLRSRSDVRGRHNPGVRPYERFNWRGVTEITQIGPAARHLQKSVQSVTRQDPIKVQHKGLLGLDLELPCFRGQFVVLVC